jgi:hypothetical protein
VVLFVICHSSSFGMLSGEARETVSTVRLTAPAALRPPSANAAGAAILGSILPLLIPCLLPRKDVIAIKPL